METRLEVWKSVAKEILDPKERKKENSYKNRAQIFKELTVVAITLPARRVSPTVTPDEFLVFNSMIKERFPFEKSPVVLQEHARYFSETILGISGFLKAEERELVYRGPYDKEDLEGTIEDMAWGLAGLAGRSDLPEVQKTALAEINKLKGILRPNKSGSNTVENVLKIFAVKEQFSLTSFGVLRESIGNSVLETPFQNIDGNGQTIRLQIKEGFTFPLEWNPSFTWLALRFPHATEVTIRQSGQDDIVINTKQVREWVISNQFAEASARRSKPANLNDFYSISGKTSTQAEIPSLQSGKLGSYMPFKFTLGFRHG